MLGLSQVRMKKKTEYPPNVGPELDPNCLTLMVFLI